MKKCKQCGVMFTPPSNRSGNNMKYCSKACRTEALRESRRQALRRFHKKHGQSKPYTRRCGWCGKPFLSHHGRKYCSLFCRKNARREQTNRHVKHYKATHIKSDKQKYFDNLGNSNLRQHRHKRFEDETRLIKAERRRLRI